MISILLVDDEALVRAGLRLILETADDLTVVGDAEDGRAAIAAVDLHRPDVVLMDLRGFSTANAGCAYELGELLEVVPIERVTLIVNRSTDEEFLIRTLEQAKASLHPSSPNYAMAVLRVPVFRETGRRSLDPDQLLRLLCEAAALPRRDQVAAQAG